MTDNFEVIVEDLPREIILSDQELAAIERYWEEEQKIKAPLLFNGKLLSLHSYEPNRIRASYVDYKHYVAQTKDPSLAEKFSIIPVSLSGFTTVGDEVIIAQRAPLVSQYPLFYELAPSGGFDMTTLQNGKVNIIAQFYKELEEELGVKPTHVEKVEALQAVVDPQAKICEICVDCRLKGAPILMRSDEYSHIHAIPFPEVSRFVTKNKDKFLPFSLFLLEQKGLIHLAK